MSLVSLGSNEDIDPEEYFKEYLDEGYKKVFIKQTELVGETLNLRWIPLPESGGSVGGVIQITKLEDGKFFGRRSAYCGKPPGEEFSLPEVFYYHPLSDCQAQSFIEPKEKRVRPPPPPSLCPSPDGENYPIKDPENSFIPREELKDTQEYYIHDNGSRPFKVLGHSTAIEIYTDLDEPVWDEEQIYNKKIAQYIDFIGLWPGFDAADYSMFPHTSNEQENSQNTKAEDAMESDNDGVKVTHCCRCHYGQTRRMDGNSLLIQLAPLKYVYVGSYIYSFETETPVTNYFSPIGNNDVPYPVAYGTNEVYFMCDDCYVTNEQIVTSRTAEEAANMYSEFYGHTPGPKKEISRIRNFQRIHKRV